MLEQHDLTKILFLDIETVPQYERYDSLPDKWKYLWDKKSLTLNYNKPEQTPDAVYPRAGIYAEFGKIVCISVGYFNRSGNFWQFRLKSFYGDDEKILLKDFCEMLERYFNNPDNLLCAHNGKEFDYPYISRRCLLNGVTLPNILNLAGKKPWEIQHLDTLELWKFGDYKSFTSLELLAAAFDIPTPKDDIDGSMVWEVYWKEKDLERIKTYCQKDVVTVAQLVLRFRNEKLLDESDVIVT
ncbi:MAG: 3'-5' exonuclease [Bacteroidota bacterium]